MDQEESPESWFRERVAKGSKMIHAGTRSVGKAIRYWSGAEGDRWTSSINGIPVDAPILELDTGHGLIAARCSWVELGPAEARFVDALRAGVSGVVQVAARTARASGVDLDTGLVLLLAVLEDQVAALKRGTT